MSKKQSGAIGIITDLQLTLERLFTEIDQPSLTVSARQTLEIEIRLVINRLDTFLSELDPISQPTSVFDPGNPKVVGRFISLALVAQARQPLAEITRSYGSGVYAIYYQGDFPLYQPLSGSESPIYVGQAAPAISNARTPMEQGDRLSRRLNEHRKNISKASNALSLIDFTYRSLVVQSGWESAAEDYLIHLFRPVWNSETNLVYGLGKHGDDAKTRSNKRSPWDTIHPGRTWASDESLVDAKSKQQIETELATHFAKHPIYPSIEFVLNSFINELRQV